MGSVVGERITRTIEYGTANRCAVIIVSASGGARMYEGMLSLMQMAKTSGALARHACERLPLHFRPDESHHGRGDGELCFPGRRHHRRTKGMIGFAGPRVIKETTHQELPEGFQTAEFLEEHGLIDLIVHRKKMRARSASFSVTFPPRSERGEARAVAEGAATLYRLPEALAWLYGTQRFGIKLGLENMQRLLRELDFPRTGPRVLHVAGTNGKGSVCAMMDAICRAQGYRTGLYTSPHLVTFRERIRVDGEMIAEEDVADGLSAIRGLVSNWDPHPTFFEITTALALMHFKRCQVNWSSSKPASAADWMQRMRSSRSSPLSRPSISITRNGWATHSRRSPAKRPASSRPACRSSPHRRNPRRKKSFGRAAAECEAPIQFVEECHLEESLALAGAHQRQNAALAIAALRSRQNLDRGAMRLRRAWRMFIGPRGFKRWDARTIIDGAHNPAGARILAQTWHEQFGDERATIILAVLHDKDVPGICQALVPICDSVILPRIRSERGLPPEELARTLSSVRPRSPTPSRPRSGMRWNAHARERTQFS